MLRDNPRWALVVWPQEDRVSCIPLGDAESAVAKGAFVIAREDADLLAGVTRVDLKGIQSNPQRRKIDKQGSD